MSTFKSKLSSLPLSEIARIAKCYAVAKRFDRQFFRDIENEIYERLHTQGQMMTVEDADKLLWAY